MPLIQIDDGELRHLRSIQERLPELNQRVGALEGELRAKDTAIKRLESEMDATRAEGSRLQGDVATLKAQVDEREARLKQIEADRDATAQRFQGEIAKLAELNVDLQNRLNDAINTAPKIKVDQLVVAFRDQVAQMNKAVLSEPRPDHQPVMVEQMEVELKGGLDVSSGLQFVQLRPEQLSAASVSTVRFTLRPGSTIKIVDD
jgi:septal ring factor EnvC (AmiA/AmiB activator)